MALQNALKKEVDHITLEQHVISKFKKRKICAIFQP